LQFINGIRFARKNIIITVFYKKFRLLSE
jgi:hypothetical protein